MLFVSNQRPLPQLRKKKTTFCKGKLRGQTLVLKLMILPFAILVCSMVFLFRRLPPPPPQQHHHHQYNSPLTIRSSHERIAQTWNATETQAKIIPKQQQQEKDNDNNHDDLPKWIQDYVRWHNEMRAQFPGDQLFLNSTAPKLLIRTCLGLCGGLHDRLGQLPWDLYLAMKLKRVLLIAWQRPRELENFLEPPTTSSLNNNGVLSIDWRVPDCDYLGSRQCMRFTFPYLKKVRSAVTELFEGEPEANPTADFWKVGFEKAMVRAGADPQNATVVFPRDKKFANARILRHRLLGHLDENVLEQRLETEGYYQDEPHWKASDLHAGPTFGRIWNLFFRPSPEVRAEIIDSMETMGLLPKDQQQRATNSLSLLPNPIPYSAVHCRVRHPKAHPRGEVTKGKNDRYPADKTGLPWEEGGPQRQFALETATKALRCATSIASKSPVYFLSDSNDLVRHVAEELQEETYVKEHEHNSSWIFPPLLQVTQDAAKVVARNVTLENAHIDRQKGRDPPAYYATFVDLYIAKMAKCVVYGIGFYAAFAAKLSGTDCAYLYAKETWGDDLEKNAKICPNTT